MCQSDYKLSFKKTLNMYEVDLHAEDNIVTSVMPWYEFTLPVIEETKKNTAPL